MGYIGNRPADSYTSFAVQHFTTSATTTYTLDNPVANENEIALFINNVRQEPGSSYAYTASGTTLTLSAATSASDTMYCVFIGKAVQTVTPAVGSVTSDMLASGNINLSGGSFRVEDGYAYGYGDNSYRIEGKDDGANARIGFVTGNSEIARFTTSGLAIGGTGAANTLDDYETGSFTPNYSTESGGESITYDGFTAGSYVKIGSLVFITGFIRTDSVSGGGSYLYLGGFPFTNASGNSRQGFIGIARSSAFVTNQPSALEMVSGGTKAFVKFRGAANDSSDNLLAGNLGTGANANIILFSGAYTTS